jgi:hypothetical protein
MIVLIILLVLVIILTIVIVRQYIGSYTVGDENIVLFSGAPGTNKTYLCIKYAIKRYHKQIFKYRIKKIKNKLFFWRPKEELEKPRLYSNIPIKLNKREWSYKLDKEHLLLVKKINKGSVIVLDEIGEVANQYSYNNVLVQVNFQELVRFVRHYGQEWYIYSTEQAIENVVVQVRRRLALNLILYKLRKYPFRFYKVLLKEEIINSPAMSLTPSEQVHYVFGRYRKSKKKYYDTHCYSERYKPVKYESERWDNYKTDVYLSIDKNDYLQKFYKEHGRLPEDISKYV